MNIEEVHLAHWPLPVKRIGREFTYLAHYSDSYGTFCVFDVNTVRSPQDPRNWFIHVVHGSVEVKSRENGSQPVRLDATGFMQMNGYHRTDIVAKGRAPARVIMAETYRSGADARPKSWPAIDTIPMTEVPEGKLWAMWDHTDLQDGVHYDHIAIGPVPGYEETGMEELPHHAHGQSDAFLYVTGGEGVCTFGQKSSPVKEGSFVAIPRGDLYGLYGAPWITAVSVKWTSTPRIVPREEDFLVPLQVPIW